MMLRLCALLIQNRPQISVRQLSPGGFHSNFELEVGAFVKGLSFNTKGKFSGNVFALEVFVKQDFNIKEKFPQR